LRFVDTSFWVALQFHRDRHHQDARALWVSRTPPLVTTNLVLGETWTFLRRRLGHPQAQAFIDRATRSSQLTVHRVDEGTEHEAWEWLRRHDERSYSFVDATSFAVMRRLRVIEALAFDGDFAAAGFVEVRP
jgi:predicted nucleic acid-binding protein